MGEYREALRWAFPLSQADREYPLINEIVNIVVIRGKLYYTNRISENNNLTMNCDFDAEIKQDR